MWQQEEGVEQLRARARRQLVGLTSVGAGEGEDAPETTGPAPRARAPPRAHRRPPPCRPASCSFSSSFLVRSMNLRSSSFCTLTGSLARGRWESAVAPDLRCAGGCCASCSSAGAESGSAVAVGCTAERAMGRRRRVEEEVEERKGETHRLPAPGCRKHSAAALKRLRGLHRRPCGMWATRGAVASGESAMSGRGVETARRSEAHLLGEESYELSLYERP